VFVGSLQPSSAHVAIYDPVSDQVAYRFTDLAVLPQNSPHFDCAFDTLLLVGSDNIVTCSLSTGQRLSIPWQEVFNGGSPLAVRVFLCWVS
jgi:hypothetical protein